MTTSATFAAARSRYATSSVTTASPARLLTMLYDRLVCDLVTAEECLTSGNIATANDNLQHAQAIILELRTSLDTTIWSGGPGLADLYTFLHEELTSANVDKDLPRVVSCREIIDPLRDAWHQAAQQDLSLRST
jgi:flagellar protein FliS